MLKLAALWAKTGDKGEFFVGKINDDTTVFMFKNKNKTSANQPDYELFLAEAKKDTQGKSAPAAQAATPRSLVTGAPFCCDKPMMVSKYHANTWYCVKCKKTQGMAG